MRIQNPGASIQNETKPLSDILKRFSCFVVIGIPVMAVSGNPGRLVHRVPAHAPDLIRGFAGYNPVNPVNPV